jgi:hypothetical protein
MPFSEQNTWARSHATPELIGWAMDLSEEERASLIVSMPHDAWTSEEQNRYAAILVVIADRDELGLSNADLELVPGRSLPGLLPESAPKMTMPEVLRTPIDELVEELAELTDRISGMGNLDETELRRLGVLWTAVNILKDPGPGPT